MRKPIVVKRNESVTRKYLAAFAVLFFASLTESAPAAGLTFYWVCELHVVLPQEAVYTVYVSGISGPTEQRIEANFANKRINDDFNAFVSQKYKVTGGSRCLGYDTTAKAEDAQKRITPDHGKPIVQTGWKFQLP